MIAGYKTITWCVGVLLTVTTSPEVQALITQYPCAAFWINNIVIVILRHYTVAPLPWRKKKFAKPER